VASDRGSEINALSQVYAVGGSSIAVATVGDARGRESGRLHPGRPAPPAVRTLAGRGALGGGEVRVQDWPSE
jgi:hypothetical protein